MPATASPFGMEAIASTTAAPNNLANRQFLIDPTYTQELFNGDCSTLLASGYVARTNGVAAAGTDQGVPNGVFSGFEFTSLVTKQRLQSNYFPGSASVLTTDPIWAYVNDDPMALFMVQMAATVNSTAATLSLLGQNAAITLNAGNVSFGRSRNSASSPATTATLPLRIIDIPRLPSNPFGTSTVPQYMNVLVRFNTHQYLTQLGV